MERRADGVLVSDENGRIVGIGRFVSFATANRFSGYAEISDSRSIVAYAFRAHGQGLCRLGEPQTLPVTSQFEK